MATVLEEEKDQEIGAPPEPATAAPTPQAPPTTKQPERSGSGRFINLQRYIQANQPVQQALGQKIGEKIQSQASDIRSGIQQSQQRFGQEIAPEQQRLAQAGQTIQSSIQQAQQAPQNLSQQQLQQFQQLREGQTFGPSVFDVGQLQQQQQQLSQTAGQIGTEAGRFGLLRQYFGKPSYTRGQQSLDQLLLQASPGSLRNLQQLGKQQVSGVEQSLMGAQQSAQDVLGQLAQQRMAAQQQAQEQLGMAQTGLETDITGAAEAEQQRRADLYNRLQQFTSGENRPNFTEEEIRSLGLDPSMQTYKLNLGNQLRQLAATPGTQVSKEQVVTPEQMARLGALAQLGGTDQSFISGPQQLQEFRPFDPEALSGAAAADVAKREYEAGHKRVSLPEVVYGFGTPTIGRIPEYIARARALKERADRARMGGGMRSAPVDFAGAIRQAQRAYDKWYAAHPLSTLGQMLGIQPSGPQVGPMQGEQISVLPPGVRS